MRGQPADARSDFYALGVLLYECIAGRRPFRGKTAPELYRVILAGERQRLREAAPECKRSVERVVDRCLSANPDERWGRASELRMQLELELNRVFDANPSARLASFLYERGHAHPEHLATINLAEIAVFDPSIEISIKESLPALSLNVDVDELEDDAGDEEASASGRFGLLRGVGVAVGLFAAAALVTWLVAPEWVQQTLQRAIALLSSS